MREYKCTLCGDISYSSSSLEILREYGREICTGCGNSIEETEHPLYKKGAGKRGNSTRLVTVNSGS